MSNLDKYDISLPLYLESEYKKIFEKRSKYIFKRGVVKQLKNCFLSNSGVLISNGLIPLNSAENLIGFEDYTFYFKHWKKAIEQYFVCRLGTSLNSMVLNDQTIYYSIHTPWFGYFSWITTCLPRLLYVIENYPEAVLIYPEEWDDIDYVKQSLYYFKGISIRKIPKDHHVFVSKYLLVPCRSWTSHFNKIDLIKVRNFFNSKVFTKSLNFGDRIYISRKKSKRRKIVNEDKLVDLLKFFHFDIICMEDFSFDEQIQIMKNTSILVSSHGAGLANVNFLNEKSKIIELTPIIDDFKKFRYPFWRMSTLLDLQYYCIFCGIANTTKDQYESDIIVDLKKIESLLIQVC